MITVSPSILACDFLNLQAEIESFKNENDLWFHLDIMDGHYVPNLTFGKTVLQNLTKITNHKLDAHFMVSNPEDYVKEYSNMGLYNFSFHWEAVTHHDRMISFVKENYESVGIAINPGTNINMIPDYIFKKIDLILIMSVNPGFGGQKFIESSFEKLKYLAEIKDKYNLNFTIQVDGGVTDQNAKSLIEAGANNLVAGSFIFKETQENYPKQIKKIRG